MPEAAVKTTARINPAMMSTDVTPPAIPSGDSSVPENIKTVCSTEWVGREYESVSFYSVWSTE